MAGFVIFSDTQTDKYMVDAIGLYTDEKYSFIPGQMRIGDLDSDGENDILATFKKVDGTSKTLVLLNTACSDSTVCNRRTFSTSNDYSSIENYESTTYAFVMDFDDNGILDFVIVSRYENGTTEIISLYNNFSRDSYYITTSVNTESSTSYGYKVHGVFCRGIYTTLSDSKYVFTSEQLTRSAYGALQYPVASYAIGRSNNFIEDLTVSYHHQYVNMAEMRETFTIERRSWSPIIPNSNLLINVNNLVASNWGIKLLVNPTDSFLLVGIVLVILLIIIGVLIIYIHRKEKQEDEESRNPNLDFL